MKLQVKKIGRRDFSIYQCPSTGQKIVAESSDTFKTADGTVIYTLRDGVLNFLNSKTWQSPDSEQLTRLILIAKKKGFKTALATVFTDTRYVLDPSRASYINLLPLNKEAQVLEIGASLGQHTKLLGAASKHVEALEVCPEQALFAQLTCDQSGLSNVCVSVGGDDCNLPYAPAAFDVVILNYVLEWCACGSRLPPRYAQELLISECYRVLKPGGVLFISTKNRYNLRLLSGALDENVSYRFGNVLPRWLVRLVSKALLHPPSSGFLHSYGALRRIISKQGFRHITAKLALPDARFPLAYSGFSKTELSTLRSDQRLLKANRLTRFLLRCVPGSIIKWVAPSLVFIAEK
jgi:SAM-dependent methyltransferase